MKKTLLLFTIIACNCSSFSQSPVLSILQPTCASPSATVQVISPLSNSGPIASNLYISEVTDANLGGLSYIEIFNGTGITVNLSNYKLKIFSNGSTTPSCNLTLSGAVSSGNVFIVAVGSSTNLGGVTPNLTFSACAGFNSNDAVMLTTNNDVAIDLWGSINGSVFTPQGQPGYTYRRHINAPVPGLTWNPSDWDALDPEDYSNIGIYSTAINYNYSLDGGALQTSPFFNQLASGTHVIAVQNTATTVTSQTPFDIMPLTFSTPVTNFVYPPVPCESTNLLIPITPANFTSGGIFFATQPLVIDISSGIIDLAQTPPGTYLITYTVAPNVALCSNGGSYTFNFYVQPLSATPQGNSDQTPTVANPTLTNLVVFPTTVSWYDSLNDALGQINSLPVNTPLLDGATYFAVNNISGCPSSPFPVTVHLNLSTATFTDSSLEIVPNPVNAVLTIQTSNNLNIDKIIISDLTGKTIITQMLLTTNNQVNVNHLAAGIYLIEGFSGNQKFQSKFIKQ